MDASTLWNSYEAVLSKIDSFTSISQAVAGVGALLYISYRIFGSLARAEQIDVFSLLRPFAIGLCIVFFKPAILDPMNGIFRQLDGYFMGKASDMSKETERTLELYEVSDDKLMQKYNVTKEEIKNYQKTGKMSANITSAIEESNSSGWIPSSEDIVNAIMKMMRWCYMAASYIIRSLSVFYLTIMSVLGPLVFAFAVFDGFQSGITAWFAKYINFSLWGVVCSILDIFLSTVVQSSYSAKLGILEQASNSAEYVAGSTSGLFTFVLYLLGIICYMNVPTIAGWIVNAGGGAGPINNMATKIGGGLGMWAGGKMGQGSGWVAGKAWSGMKAGGRALKNAFSKPD